MATNENLIKPNAQPTTQTPTLRAAGTATQATTTPAVNVPQVTPQSGAELQAQYNQRKAESDNQINTLYNNQIAAQKQQLKTAYDQNLSDQQAARNQIGTNYQTAANDLAIQYERNRRNLNEQALANGLNTGTGSQQQLALNQQYNTNFGKLRGQEAAAVTEADRQIANLKMNYQNQISQAIADNDFQRATALMNNYNTQQNWLDAKNERAEEIGIRQRERAEDQAIAAQNLAKQYEVRAQERAQDQAIAARNLQQQYDVRAQERAEDRKWQVEDQGYNRDLDQAKIAASFGDFSIFAKLYGKEVANAMKQTWAAQNPDIAWATGNISKDDYYKLTGQDPHERPSGGGGGGSSGGIDNWWNTVEGMMASGKDYNTALNIAVGGK